MIVWFYFFLATDIDVIDLKLHDFQDGALQTLCTGIGRSSRKADGPACPYNVQKLLRLNKDPSVTLFTNKDLICSNSKIKLIMMIDLIASGHHVVEVFKIGLVFSPQEPIAMQNVDCFHGGFGLQQNQSD